MKTRSNVLLAVATLVVSLSIAPAVRAMGPVDAEAGLLWWVHEVDTPELGTVDADDAGAYFDIWFGEKWGFSINMFGSDPDERGLSSSTDTSFDLKWRMLSPTENNFLALGGGWYNAEHSAGSSADGPRLMLEGRVGVGILFGYGKLAYMPDLGDSGLRRDLDATELDLGASLTPFPFLNLRLGYRTFDLNFNGGSEQSSGPYLGAAIHF